MDRRSFLGSGLVLAVSMARPLPLQAALLEERLASGVFLELQQDSLVRLYLNKSEMGQGVMTGLAQIVADELGVAWDAMRLVQARAEARYADPISGRMITGGSTSIRHMWRPLQEAAAAADLTWALDTFKLSSGFLKVAHPHKKYGLQAAAFRLNIPYTGHPMFGHDIIYSHPLNSGAAIGRTAQRDFLAFAHSVSRINGGVYISIGSAVMSPMIFEKSLAMAQNLSLQRGRHMEDVKIYVVDLVEAGWDWNRGEPPPDNPAYYVRFLKTFSRMGGEMTYIQADNRDFLLSLYGFLSR